jgi:PIN domain nuclease of toxin-antitoxin system
LDASALLALLLDEPGAEMVEAVADRAAISTVNWSEVFRRSAEHDVDLAGLRGDVEALGLEIVPFTVADAESAAELHPMTRHLGLSLGDRACLALAARLELPTLTADRSWVGAELGVEIRPIR